MSYFFFCLATVFIVLLSIIAIDSWPSWLARASILSASLIPFSMAVFEGIPRWVNEKKLPSELILLALVLVFGAANMFFSDDTWATVKGMGLFLIAGPFVLVTTGLLVNSRQRRVILFYILTGCLLFFCFLGLYQYLFEPWGPVFQISLLSFNPIPAASVLLLLVSGPTLLLARADNISAKICFGIVALFGAFMVVLIFKKGPILGLVVALIFSGFFFVRKFGIFMVVSTVLLAGYISTGYISDKTDPFPFGRGLNSVKFQEKYLNRDSSLVRMELFRFSKVLFKENPFFGIGYNASLVEYLPENYEAKYLIRKKKCLTFFEVNLTCDMRREHYSLEEYFEAKSKNTLDNIVLSLVVETGILFTFSYMVFLFPSGWLLFKAIINKDSNRSEMICLVAILLGFFVHSLTFDSLKYPNLNWVFHMLVGMAANLYFNRDGTFFNLGRRNTHKEI